MQSQRRSLRTRVSYAVKEDYYDSRHCAGINCLVLDPTTPSSRLSGGAGILYSGGRDSIINSWDLNLDFAGIRAREEELLETQAEHVNQRRASVSNKSENRYSRTPSIPQRKQSLSAPNDLNTPTADSPSQHASELLSDDATASPLGRSPPNEDFHDRISNLRREEYIRKTRSVQFSSLKGNRSFSVPEAEIQKRSYKIFEKLPQSTFLRSFQSHSDWVNDIVLCNGNQNLISASSDRMVLLWSTVDNFHVALGQHSDYVKVLAHPSGQSWVASAGLDRRIILWDVNEARGEVTSFKSKG
ncbi:WD40-repeat-containing domain protein [Zopfochytrium polystomum]|nr:WD40-repeat-containing domain protein [Zopfochytrium polystomum]